MKGQDILLLVSLHVMNKHGAEDQSVRQLASITGIGKSEVSNAIKRNENAGLLKKHIRSKKLMVNIPAMLEFLLGGLKYVFPATPGALARGVATGFDCPLLKDIVLSDKAAPYVWPDGSGELMGQSIEPLFASVPESAKQNEATYKILALIDALRIGNPREYSIAKEMLTQEFSHE
jgi:hypothetical protein